jgi:tetratricopeptide (TPR) repeat protein
MKWSNSLVVLVILLLVFAALVVRNMQLTAYSQEQVQAELSKLCEEYAELSARGAEEPEWLAFEQKVRGVTKPLIADLEKQPGYNPLRQLAMYDLPEAIASRGKIPAIDHQLGIDIARANPATLDQVVRRPAGGYGLPHESDSGLDLWLIGMVVLDGGLLIAIGYMLFWPVRKRLFVPKDLESTLRQLDKRIEGNPDAVRFLATRARLLAEAERHDEAIADIDRILDQHAHGVDLDKWRELRETVVQRKTAQEKVKH